MQPVHLDLRRLPESNDKQTVIRLDGKLSLETVHNFVQTMRAESATQLILDLGGVAFLDSAGVGAMVQVFVHRRNQGQSLALTRLTKQGSAVIQVAGLTKLLPIHGTVADALAVGA